MNVVDTRRIIRHVLKGEARWAPMPPCCLVLVVVVAVAVAVVGAIDAKAKGSRA